MFTYLKNKDKTFLYLVIFAYIFIYSFIGWTKHQHFQTFAWDTAIFDQQLFLVSNFKVPFSSLHGFMGLGDHFHPLLYIVGGLGYKIWANVGTLFIIQSAVACLSAVPLYLSAKYVLKKSKLSSTQIIVISLLVVITYLGSVSFQFMVTGEYNDAPSVALPLLFLLYFIYKKNELGFWIAFGFMLLTKEEYSLLAIPIAFYLYIKWKSWKKALVALVIGFAYFYILTFYLMPSISGTKDYIFFTNKNKPQNIVKEMVNKPALFITKFLDDSEKRKTILISAASFGFLPLLSKSELLIPVTNLAIRFYDSSLPRRYEFNNQYASGLIPPLAFAGVVGIGNLVNFLYRRKFNQRQVFLSISFYLIAVFLYQDIIFHGPVNSILKSQFYQTHSWETDAHELIRQVPPEVTVASQNSLLPHLSQRQNFYLLPKVGDAEYIVVDLTDGPNKFAPVDLKRTEDLISSLINHGDYKIVWSKNEAILLHKNQKANFL